MKQQVEQLVQHCPACTKAPAAPKQPMLPTLLPEYPWQQSDLHQICLSYTGRPTYSSQTTYIYVEVQTLTSTTSASIIRMLKSIFARHGIPETFVSNNEPQYSSQEIKDFARDCNFVHVTSSSYHPQSNGLAKRIVQTLKSLIGKSSDPYPALLLFHLSAPYTPGVLVAASSSGCSLLCGCSMILRDTLSPSLPLFSVDCFWVAVSFLLDEGHKTL